MNLFSFPQFVPGGSYTTAGYYVTVSRNVNGAPNYFGPYVALSGYSPTTLNTDIYDATGAQNDVYRVTPVINITGGPSGVTFNTAISRPFFATQPLWDVQISMMLSNFRQSYTRDIGIPLTDSTLTTESTGSNVMPFMTDSLTTRFYLSFLQNDDPIKLMANNALVYLGASKSAALPLVQYSDFYVNEIGGYIDFKVAPPVTDYMRVEYTKVAYTDDELRNLLINSISNLSLYGINGFQVLQSNNLSYLAGPLPYNDLAEIVMMIAFKKLIDQQFGTELAAAESWKDGKVEWSADPGRALQAAASRLGDIEPDIQARANNYIYNTRTYYSRGEFESYFDTSGVLPLYSLIVAGANLGGALGFWL